LAAAPNADAAAAKMDEFERAPWGQKFHTVVASWSKAWDRVMSFFAFPRGRRGAIYTTNATESLHSQLRKIIKTRGDCLSDGAAITLIWLALRNITADWCRAVREWREAMNQFARLYDERLTLPVQAGL
jgi:transposase-like protein